MDYSHVDDRRACSVATFAFIYYILVFGTVKCLGVLLPHIQEEFSTETWIIGFIVSLGYELGTLLSKKQYTLVQQVQQIPSEWIGLIIGILVVKVVSL